MTKLEILFDGLFIYKDNKVTAKDTDATTFLNQIKELEAKRRELEQEALENYAQIRADMKEIRILKAENKKYKEALELNQRMTTGD